MNRTLTLVMASALLMFAAGCGETEAKTTSKQPASRSAKVLASQSACRPSSRPAEKTLTLLTYNVLADPGPRRRLPALMKLLERSNADVIALQEVTPRFLKRLAGEKWCKRYHQVSNRRGPVAPGGLHILSKFPIIKVKYRRFPGRQGRGALVVRVQAHRRSLAVGTIHLESPLGDGPVRVKQMVLLWPMLNGADDAVVMGDFNFGDGEKPESNHLPKRFADVWLALHPKLPGYTWNIEKNPMAREGSFKGEKSRRLDRILLRSSFYRPSASRIVGHKPVDGKRGLFPSDHFGLFGRLVAGSARATSRPARSNSPETPDNTLLKD